MNLIKAKTRHILFNAISPAAIAFLTVILLASCGGKEKHQLKPYTSNDGGFSVELPGAPTLSSKAVLTPFGKKSVQVVRWKPANMDIYKIKLVEITFTNCPQSLIYDSVHLNRLLDSSINMKKADYSEKSVHIENIEFNGYPGRSFIYDMSNDNSIAIVKQFIANNRRYEMTVVASSNQGTVTETSEIFNSFKVLK